jgi:predicted aconitase
MGIEPTCTCIPYYGETAPLSGEHLAWAESSAVVFANSVLGAYTNREGGPTALASSVLGLTPLYGIHIDENRRPTHLVKIKCSLNDDLDHSILGYWIGKNLGCCIPRIQGLSASCPRDRLKSLGASMAASGSVAMFLVGESDERESVDVVTIGKEELIEVRHSLSSEEDFQHVVLGCPHLSLEELKMVSDLVSGRKLTKNLWCFTSRYIRDVAKTRGYVDVIEGSGGKVICDTCIVVSPMTDRGMEGLVTNSCKAAHYLRSLNRIETCLMSFERCVQYALA